MKKLFLFFSLVLMGCAMAQAQCGKSVVWSSSKTQYLDSAGTLQKELSQATTVKTTAKHVVFSLEGGDQIEGDINELDCAWKEAFKNGRTHFRSLFAKPNGETREGSVTIEAKDGKMTILLELENYGGKKIRLLVDGYKTEA